MNSRNPVNAGVKHVNVPPSAVGQRLDNYLLRSWKGVPRSHVYRLIRAGQVRVNGSRSRVFRKLKDGDILRLPPIRLDDATSRSIPMHLRQLKVDRLYEDENLLIINKPSGIPVHGGTRLRAGIIEILRFQQELEDSYLELVHRIDRDTSGCLILAKEPQTLKRLHSYLRDDKEQIRKRYLALLCGKWVGGAQSINFPLESRRFSPEQRRSVVTNTGRAANSLFTPVESFTEYSLVQIELVTGRTHQIRAHASAIGHPVAGDTKYGLRQQNRSLHELGLRRLFLHAHDIRLTHPKSGAIIDVSAPLEKDLSQFLELVRQKHA